MKVVRQRAPRWVLLVAAAFTSDVHAVSLRGQTLIQRLAGLPTSEVVVSRDNEVNTAFAHDALATFAKFLVKPGAGKTIEEYMPICLRHLRALVRNLRKAYTHANLRTVLMHACLHQKMFPAAHAGVFESPVACLKFADGLVAAADEELETGSQAGYPPLCGKYFETYGPFDPTAAPPSTTPFATTTAPEEGPKVDLVDIGSDKCPCVGFAHVKGNTTVIIDGKKVAFPADLGARCAAWEQDVHPDCIGASTMDKEKAWCFQQWCYVDPCKCDLPVPPVTSSYMPDGKFQGNPVYFSYMTCGSPDKWTKENHPNACVNQKTVGDCDMLEKCAWNGKKCLGKELVLSCKEPKDPWVVGSEDCKCVGIDGQEGEILVGGLSYPADLGASCRAWDKDITYACKVPNPPAWCEKRWCYVDATKCSVDKDDSPPKLSEYLPGATFQNTPLHYSYDTCPEEKVPYVKPVDIGSPKCPCIGFAHLEGNLSLMIDGKKAVFPAEMGGSCAAWDEDHHPDCKGDGAHKDFCSQKWCYVDPCNCDLPELPKTSMYMPTATFQGTPIYYSYMTCGNKDKFTADNYPDACVNQQSKSDCEALEKCAWSGKACLGKELLSTCNVPKNATKVGAKGCRCIGIDGQEGQTIVDNGFTYPADLGSSCKAWDKDLAPECKLGEDRPKWCDQQWCFVDPVDCELPGVPPPGVSAYLTGASFQNKPLHFSYDTCPGGKAPPPVNKADIGSPKCPCIGIANVEGNTTIELDGVKVAFPADLGARCEAWDQDYHPLCINDEEWCSQKWCYVDPCNCDLPVPPKTSSYLPDGKFQGIPVYFSYQTCGGTDEWTEENHPEACVNQKSETVCSQLEKCAWDGKQCLGKELVHHCNAPKNPTQVGHEECRCIGITGQKGEKVVNGVAYPAALGSECKAWDQDVAPECKIDGFKPEWCDKHWCFVDATKCELPNDAFPKLSEYLPGASFQNKPLYISHETCPATKDLPTPPPPVNKVDLGSTKCPCIGFANVEGSTIVNINGTKVNFPADLGSSCKAWEQDHHPKCINGEGEEWCKEAWCYVDPCNCDLPHLPKKADHLPFGRFQGNHVYYSYMTCGGTDKFTGSGNYPDACVNQKSEEECKTMADCAWDSNGKECMGKELLATCSEPKDEKKVGKKECQCIGIAGQQGEMIAKGVSYPADLGAECGPWDKDAAPECMGTGDKPAWCNMNWCFVDPYDCKLPVETPPKLSLYMPGASFQNRPLFFSYATCPQGDAPGVVPAPVINAVDIGNGKCPCIGFANIEGVNTIKIGAETVAFPGDLGGRCEAWEKDTHPSCIGGKGEDWCNQKWCYVDPCNCDLPTLPKTSAYLPDGKYQGRPVYYSYATCGSEDTWTKDNHPDACVNQKTEMACLANEKCGWSGKECLGKELIDTCSVKVDPWVVGFKGCRCIGISGQTGNKMANGVTYPVDIGSECKAWDEEFAPECQGSGVKPEWCSVKWCFIDPCDCELPEDTPPKLSAYFEGVSYHNRPMYYSYATCHPGTNDTWTPQMNPGACVNRATEVECSLQAKCKWTGTKCLGRELAGMC